MAAIQVETEGQALAILTKLDTRMRVFYLDIERKQNLDLMQLARTAVSHAEIRPIKPNDLTVDALFALLMDRLGPDLTNIPTTVVGTGNLAFKFALRLAECGAQVGLHGRNPAKAKQLASAANLVLPSHTPHSIIPERIESSKALIAAISGNSAITPTWLSLLDTRALCVDVGIGNFAPEFIRAANTDGHECVRLDVRSAGDPLPVHPNPFFYRVAGRRTYGQASLVAGGLIGNRGEIVVDAIRRPTRILGIANGAGALLPEPEWSDCQKEQVRALTATMTNMLDSASPTTEA